MVEPGLAPRDGYRYGPRMDWISHVVDPERRLALAYASSENRQSLALLWVLDERLGAAVAATREEMLGQIRLVWWREALENLPDRVPAGEPLLKGLAFLTERHRVPSGLLARLPEGWMALLAPVPLETDVLRTYAAERGAALFQLGSILLNGEAAGLEDAGAMWALVDLAARVSDRVTADRAVKLAAEHSARLDPGRWPRRLRPLRMLAALAVHDLRAGLPRRQGSPRRLAIALRIGAIGR